MTPMTDRATRASGHKGGVATRLGSTGGYLVVTSSALLFVVGAIAMAGAPVGVGAPGVGGVILPAALTLGGLGAGAIGLGGPHTLDGRWLRIGLVILGLGLLGTAGAAVFASTLGYDPGESLLFVVLFLVGGWATLIGAVVSVAFLVRAKGRPRVAALLFIGGLLLAAGVGMILNVLLADTQSDTPLVQLTATFVGATAGAFVLAAWLALGLVAIGAGHVAGLKAAGRPTLLVLVGARLTLPSPLFADTDGTAGPVAAVQADSFGPLESIIQILAILVLLILLVVGLAYGVARIGGQPVEPAGGRRAVAPRAASSRRAMAASGAVLVAASVAGVLAGRAAVKTSSQGGLEGAFAIVDLVLLGGALVLGLVSVGLVATRFRHGHISPAISTVLLCAGVLVAGIVGGAVTAPATGGLYRDPVELRAAAALDLQLDGTPIRFAARVGGKAECRSVPDGQAVRGFTGLDLGELGPGTLRGDVTLGAGQPATATAVFFIDGGDLPEGSSMVSWSGASVVGESTPNGRTGRLSFIGLERTGADSKTALGSPLPSSSGDWPQTLSGSLGWICESWSGTEQSLDVVPPPSRTPVLSSAQPATPTATAVPSDVGDGAAFVPPDPSCPSPPHAVVVPEVLASISGGPVIHALRGSSTFATCTSAATEDRVMPTPTDSILARAGDSITLSVPAGWRFLRWEGSESRVAGDPEQVWEPVEVAGEPDHIGVPVPARTGDSIVRYRLWLIGLDGRIVGQLEISFRVTVS